MTVIDDHPHDPLLRGRWRSGTCAICGRPNDTHMSYGRAVARKLGGTPLDYMRTVEDAGWTPPDPVSPPPVPPGLSYYWDANSVAAPDGAAIASLPATVIGSAPGPVSRETRPTQVELIAALEDVVNQERMDATNGMAVMVSADDTLLPYPEITRATATAAYERMLELIRKVCT